MNLLEDVWREWRISATELDCVRYVAGKAYAYHVTKIEVLTGNLVNAVEGTYPKANTPITNQEKASLVLMPHILLNGVADVNGVPFI